ncbi:hypothetical protein KGF56_002246 [Candida oxycetoniae]|uniref:Late endosome and vacuole interface protein 10 n=1 Tax=Candida oxycetoniae TaxID=497107 RepID=A0AAI9SY56_9ASCO|nr:uncharacterized protein KGF56_002246 [Candida oxycetoniae]KAI3404917.2 hypothetical protein KGF56_002246 [Candida oxycetoniae]
MSSASLKKIAAKNKVILDQLLYISIFLNLLIIVVLVLLRRPRNFTYYIIFTIPSIVIQYLLEAKGRPKLDQNQRLLKSGDDILQKGSLFQYCFDVIYLTWFFDILMVLFGTNKVWLGYLVIPGYIGYKLSGFILPFLKKSKKTKEMVDTKKEENDSGLSKRQSKLRARQEKGPTTKYR